MNLIFAIKAVESEMNLLENKYTAKRYELTEALEALRRLNTVCEKCDGKGKNLRSRSCAEDDRPDENDPKDYVVCDTCKGTGVVKAHTEITAIFED